MNASVFAIDFGSFWFLVHEWGSELICLVYYSGQSHVLACLYWPGSIKFLTWGGSRMHFAACFDQTAFLCLWVAFSTCFSIRNCPCSSVLFILEASGQILNVVLWGCPECMNCIWTHPLTHPLFFCIFCFFYSSSPLDLPTDLSAVINVCSHTSGIWILSLLQCTAASANTWSMYKDNVHVFVVFGLSRYLN